MGKSKMLLGCLGCVYDRKEGGYLNNIGEEEEEQYSLHYVVCDVPACNQKEPPIEGRNRPDAAEIISSTFHRDHGMMSFSRYASVSPGYVAPNRTRE